MILLVCHLLVALSITFNIGQSGLDYITSDLVLSESDVADHNTDYKINSICPDPISEETAYATVEHGVIQITISPGHSSTPLSSELRWGSLYEGNEYV